MNLTTLAPLAAIIAAIFAALTYFWPREGVDSFQHTLLQSSNYRRKASELLADRRIGQSYLHLLRHSLVGAWRVFGRSYGSKALALSVWFAFFYGWLFFWAIWIIGSISEFYVLGVSLKIENLYHRFALGLSEIALPMFAVVSTHILIRRTLVSKNRLMQHWNPQGRLIVRLLVYFGIAVCLFFVVSLDLPNIVDGRRYKVAFGSNFATPFLYATTGIVLTFCTVRLLSKIRFTTRFPVVAVPVGGVMSGSITYTVGALINHSGPFGIHPPVLSLPIELCIIIPFAALFFVPLSVIVTSLSISFITTIALSIVLDFPEHPYITGIFAVTHAIFGVCIFFGCILAIICGTNGGLINRFYPTTLTLNASIGVLLGAGAYLINFTVGTIATFFLVMLILVPVVNGVSDWASWWLSRMLGWHLRTQLRKTQSVKVYCFLVTQHGLADFVMALSLLGLVAFLLGFTYELVDFISPGTVFRMYFQPNLRIDSLVHAPLESGLWFTVMLLSTLVPTGAHLLFLLFSPLLLFLRDAERRRRWCALLEPSTYCSLSDEEKFDLTREVAEWRDRRHRRPALWVVSAILVLSFFELFLIGADTAIEIIIDEDTGLAKIIGQMASLGVELAKLISRL